MIKRLIGILMLTLITGTVNAADGFREFKFGGSLEDIKAQGQNLCRFGKEIKHTRWQWRTQLKCTGYRFKGDQKAVLYFLFTDGELVKIHVVSREIPDYFLRRYPEYNYLLPKKAETRKKSTNLADELIFKDNVHRLADEYSYITFFYEGKWEWEYIYESKYFSQNENRKIRNLLDDEVESGLDGWNKFKFNESLKEIRDKLEGMCASFSVVAKDSLETVMCGDFIFLDKPIELFFIFESSGLSKIELKLTKDWYNVLLPLLKRKYGQPYLELEENDLYYPSIEFPKVNVVLAFKRDEQNDNSPWLALKYIREGYEDKDQFLVQQREKRKASDAPATAAERILDSI